MLSSFPMTGFSPSPLSSWVSYPTQTCIAVLYLPRSFRWEIRHWNAFSLISSSERLNLNSWEGDDCLCHTRRTELTCLCQERLASFSTDLSQTATWTQMPAGTVPKGPQKAIFTLGLSLNMATTTPFFEEEEGHIIMTFSQEILNHFCVTPLIQPWSDWKSKSHGRGSLTSFLVTHFMFVFQSYVCSLYLLIDIALNIVPGIILPQHDTTEDFSFKNTGLDSFREVGSWADNYKGLRCYPASKVTS